MGLGTREMCDVSPRLLLGLGVTGQLSPVLLVLWFQLVVVVLVGLFCTRLSSRV